LSLSNLRPAGELSEELVLLCVSLVATMSVLGGSIDELDVKLLCLPGLGAWHERLAESDWSLAGTSHAALKEDEVFFDCAVMREATHRSDVLVDGISIAHGVVGDSADLAGSDAVDFLVELGSRVVTLLTTAGNSPLDGGGMPRSDTGDFAEASMRLTVEPGASEPLDGANCALTAGDANGVDDVVHVEDIADAEFLLELAIAPIDLLSDAAAVDLDLQDVGLVLAEVELADLGGAEDAHDRAVLLDAGEVAGDRLLGVRLVLVGVLGEGLLLCVSPVLVHAAFHLGIQVCSPDSGEGAEATRSLNVTDQADDLHWRALQNSDGMDNVLLDHLLAFTSLLVLHNVSHACLVAHESSEVDGAGSVITRE